MINGLDEFIGGVEKANGVLEKLRPQQTILQKGFDAVSDSISAFGERLWDIATVTIGVILRDAFEWLLRTLKDIVASSFEAAAGFQLIEMRLKGLNLQDAIDSGLEYTDAMAAATEATKEQMDWVMKLAAITPYDAEDIAKTFTMATAFGFNATSAKELTENILDFTAAMGLGSQEQERIIINLGQMVQRGKITTREMNDLARGSLLPLNDVLQRIVDKMNEGLSMTPIPVNNTRAIAEGNSKLEDYNAHMAILLQRQSEFTASTKDSTRMGLTRQMIELQRKIDEVRSSMESLPTSMIPAKMTVQELTKLISKPGGGIDPQLFIDAFNEMVNTEERYKDAAVRMAHTFTGAMENIRQSLRDVIGYFILLPGFLDPIGQRLGDIMDEVGERWGEITDAAGRVGTALGDITNAVLDIFFPSSEKVVDGLIGSLDKLADWLTVNKDAVVNFFKGVADFLFGKEVIKFSFEGGFTTEREGGALETFGTKAQGVYDWFVLNWPKIDGFFSNIGRIIEEDIVPWIENHLVPAFDEIKKWIDDNKPTIDKFFETLGNIGENVIGGLTGEKGGKGEQTTLATILDKILEVLQWVIDNEDGIATFVENWVRFAIFTEVVKIAAGILYGYIVDILANMTGVLMLAALAKWSELQTDIENIKEDFQTMKSIDMAATFQSWIDKLKGSEWFQAGAAIMQNIIDGMGSLLNILVTKVVNMMITAWNAALAQLGLPPVPYFDNIEVGGGGGSGTSSGSGSSGGVTPTSKTGNLGDLLQRKTKGLPTQPSPGVPTGAVVSPTTVASTSNYNLTINTKAPKENIIQDYAVLKSMKG